MQGSQQVVSYGEKNQTLLLQLKVALLSVGVHISVWRVSHVSSPNTLLFFCLWVDLHFLVGPSPILAIAAFWVQKCRASCPPLISPSR